MRPEPAPTDSFSLLCKRVHEAEGRGRRAFVLFQAASHPGPLVWILPSYAPEMPMLRGLPRGVGERQHTRLPVAPKTLIIFDHDRTHDLECRSRHLAALKSAAAKDRLCGGPPGRTRRFAFTQQLFCREASKALVHLISKSKFQTHEGSELNALP